MEQWFLAQVAFQRSFGMTRGCRFGRIGNEVTENAELIRQDLCPIFEVVKNKLAAFFIKEKAKGRLSKDAEEDQMADFLSPQYRARYSWVRYRGIDNMSKRTLRFIPILTQQEVDDSPYTMEAFDPGAKYGAQ